MTRHSQQVQIVWGHKTSHIDKKIHDIVPWIREAGRPYFDIFLRSNDVDAIIARWLNRRSSELALRRTRLLIADDRIAGGYVSLAGGDLAGCRQADLLDLAREMGEHSYKELRSRVDDLSDLFAPVEDHDFYLSKLGVLPRMEGHDLSQHLLEDCLRRARQGGFGRVRTDVPEHRQETREFYATYGFRPIYRGKTSKSDLRYLSMVCGV